MQKYLLMLALIVSACAEFEDDNYDLGYTPPTGYTLMTDKDRAFHVWARIEGNRLFLREVGGYSGIDLGVSFVDYNCANYTYRNDSGETGSVRDLPPDSIGRNAYWTICGRSS